MSTRRVTLREFELMSETERQHVTTVTFDTEVLHVLRSSLDTPQGGDGLEEEATEGSSS